MREYLKVPKGRYEFNGSEVIRYVRYVENGTITEEIWTKDGSHWSGSSPLNEIPLEGLKNLIDAELSN